MNTKTALTEFQTGLKALGLSYSESLLKTSLAFLEFLQKWNQYHNLTAITDLNRMITHHLLDSLSVAPYLRGNVILDVGSGGGFPGIPLALFFPEKKFILLDSRSKKTTFLREAVSTFHIRNVTVVTARVESYHPDTPIDAVICRAFGTAAKIIEYTQHLLNAGGRWLMMKGVYPEKELLELCYPFVVHRLCIPECPDERHLVEVMYDC